MAERAPPELRIAVVSTFPPRPCGIGTFARDLTAALGALPQPVGCRVAAIDAAGERYDYAPVVRLHLEEGDRASYLAAAQQLNRMRGVDLVSLQHDFGKFGVWPAGGAFAEDYLAPMLAVLAKPAVVTMHTITPFPDDRLRATVRAMGERAAAIVVMAHTATELLREDYGLDEAALGKVHTIPHGVPACPRTRAAASLDAAKRAVGLSGHRVLATFGLLHESKGIEDAIDAMPALLAAYPDLLYLVIGQTHPEVRKAHGEAYRTALQARCRALGVERAVRFVNRFLAQRELLRYLAATDVYVTPYLSRSQITSGTLAYALGCGKAIVSTPYLYATEALAEGRGLLAEFRNADSLANAIGRLLGDPGLRRRVEEQAGRYGEAMAWSRVAQRYRDLFAAVLGGRPALPAAG